MSNNHTIALEQKIQISGSLIDARIKKLKEIIEENQLIIPFYQRPYRWTEKNVLQLLEDIYESWTSVRSAYRIGSLIIYEEKNNSKHEIIDGQQRITTLTLILLNLNSEEGNNLANNLRFHHSDSEKNIRQNFYFIKDWLNEKIGDEQNIFLSYLLNFCEFVVVEVKKDLALAFQMFDSQNSRGKSLEPYNLLKAYHIRALDEEGASDISKIHYDKQWEAATRFVKNPLDVMEVPKDILRQLFNEQLYRTRIWSKQRPAYRFNKNEIEEFKGFSIKKNEQTEFPFQNRALMHFISANYFNSLQVEIRGMKSRFQNKNLSNINPFVSINQPIINGKSFFEYIESYVEIYKQLFIFDKDDYTLTEFKNFYKEYCYYPNYYRTGDYYLRELYKSLVILMFDKFGEEGLNLFYKDLYSIVYRLRLMKFQVRYETVAKYPYEMELFSIIENSRNYFDLRKLKELTKEKFEVNPGREKETKIREFFNQKI